MSTSTNARDLAQKPSRGMWIYTHVTYPLLNRPLYSLCCALRDYPKSRCAVALLAHRIAFYHLPKHLRHRGFYAMIIWLEETSFKSRYGDAWK